MLVKKDCPKCQWERGAGTRAAEAENLGARASKSMPLRSLGLSFFLQKVRCSRWSLRTLSL